jgi:hypothetical protein
LRRTLRHSNRCVKTTPALLPEAARLAGPHAGKIDYPAATGVALR